jgi:hypothetical protein
MLNERKFTVHLYQLLKTMTSYMRLETEKENSQTQFMRDRDRGSTNLCPQEKPMQKLKPCNFRHHHTCYYFYFFILFILAISQKLYEVNEPTPNKELLMGDRTLRIFPVTKNPAKLSCRFWFLLRARVWY